MNHHLVSLLMIIGIFCSMLLFVYLGNRLAAHHTHKYPEREQHKNKIIEGAIFALMGLLIALTFAGARERFDIRRTLVIEEANAIETAYFRLDLLPIPARTLAQKTLKDYLDTRLTIYKKMPHLEAVVPEIQRSQQLQTQLWNISINACKQESNSAACIVLLPALNQMVEVANSRLETLSIHPPAIILITLLILALFSAALSGYNSPVKTTLFSLHIFIYAIIITFTIFIIVNLEYPYLGLIHVNYFNDVLINVATRIP